MSTDNDVPWSGPEPDDKQPWEQQDEPPSKPLPKKATPSQKEPFFKWIGGAVLPPDPKCPRCRGDLEYRRRDDAAWCRPCDRAFYHRSIMDVLHAAGLWFL